MSKRRIEVRCKSSNVKIARLGGETLSEQNQGSSLQQFIHFSGMRYSEVTNPNLNPKDKTARTGNHQL
jgi:hypothetical protein